MSTTEQKTATERPPTLDAKSLAIGLTVNDLERSFRFYAEGLGFEIDDRFEEEGEVRGYMLKAGNVKLGISQDDWAKGRDRVKGVGLRLWIDTEEDIHAIADRAKAAGIALDEGPAALEWGPLAVTVTDPDGFKITILKAS